MSAYATSSAKDVSSLKRDTTLAMDLCFPIQDLVNPSLPNQEGIGPVHALSEPDTIFYLAVSRRFLGFAEITTGCVPSVLSIAANARGAITR